MYNLKHYKPRDQTPSSFLFNNIKKIVIPNKPILDIACGYGRNGGFLAYKDCRVVFIDNDIDCLKYIQTGKDLSIYGDVKTENIRVLYKNLNLGKLPFPNDSVGGIIDIHYYNPCGIVFVLLNIMLRCKRQTMVEVRRRKELVLILWLSCRIISLCIFCGIQHRIIVDDGVP